jgi:hypothetical protein
MVIYELRRRRLQDHDLQKQVMLREMMTRQRMTNHIVQIVTRACLLSRT